MTPHFRLAPLLAALLIALPGLVTAPLPAEAAGSKASASSGTGGSTESDLPPMPATKSRRPVTLNFVNAEIEAVSRAIGAALNRQILVDPRVRGQMTIDDEKPMPLAEAWRRYLSALRGMGFTVVENAGWLKVVPESEGKLQAGTVQIGQPQVRGDQIITQIFSLNHENPNNLVAILRPLISPNNTINANPSNGTLIITDYADNLQRLAQVISALDRPAASEVEVITVRHAVASDLAPLVQKLVDSSASPGGPQGGPNQTTATTILVESRTNSLIIRTANPARMAVAKSLIAKLDRQVGSGGPAGNIWVVYLKNADAVKLAEVLRAAMASGNASGGSSGSGLSGATSRPSAPSQAPNAGGQGGASVATTPVAASASPSTGGQIQADPATNSLIISASEPVYRQMRQVIDQLDTRRAQVYVESMIVKVDAEKAAEFGIQWQGLLGGTNGGSTALYSGTNFGSGGNNLLGLSLAAATGSTSSTTGTTLPGQGMNIGLLQKIGGAWTLGALARFLETNTGANILSTPNIVALDNEEAKIVIGSNVPFVTGQFTNTGTTGGSVNPFQTIERKDVGITLKIKSQIGEGGTIRMTIYQESSSLRADSSSITDKSSIETTVVVDDGQTMVLGGLLKDEFGDSEGRVPGLGSLPLVGGLFRNDSRKRVKSNLMLFLRPVVIRTPQAAEQLTMDRYDTIRAQQQAYQPESSTVMPVGGGPILPARPGVPDGTVPATAPAPGTPQPQLSDAAPRTAPAAPTSDTPAQPAAAEPAAAR